MFPFRLLYGVDVIIVVLFVCNIMYDPKTTYTIYYACVIHNIVLYINFVFLLFSVPMPGHTAS